MNGWWLLPISLLAGELPAETVSVSGATTVAMTSDLDFRQLRLRDARRQVRDLRLDINFAEERIAELPNERMLVHHTIELDNLDKDVVREIDQIFDERETRLRQRLALLLNQLEAAERRLNGLSVVKPRLKQQVVTGKMKPRLAKEIAQ